MILGKYKPLLFLLSAMALLIAYTGPFNLSFSSLNSRYWPHFYNECLAFASLLLLLLGLASISHVLKLPKYCLFVFGVASLPLWQWLFDTIFYFGDAFLVFIYLIGFSLSVFAGFNLRDRFGLDFFLFCGALFFLALGLLLFYMALYQFFRLDYASEWIFTNTGVYRIFGNMRQPNHFSTLSLVVFLSCWYLHEVKFLSRFLLLILICCALSVMVLSQSRTALLGLLCVVVFLYVSRKKINFNFSFWSFVCVFPLYILLDFISIGALTKDCKAVDLSMRFV
jgi:hypothetical protein